MIYGYMIEDQKEFSPYAQTQAGTDGLGKTLMFLGFLVIVASVAGFCAVYIENRDALEKYCLVLVLLMVMELLVICVIVNYLDQITEGSKQQVIRLFTRVAKDISGIDKIQRSVSIYFCSTKVLLKIAGKLLATLENVTLKGIPQTN